MLNSLGDKPMKLLLFWHGWLHLLLVSIILPMYLHVFRLLFLMKWVKLLLVNNKKKRMYSYGIQLYGLQQVAYQISLAFEKSLLTFQPYFISIVYCLLCIYWLNIIICYTVSSHSLYILHLIGVSSFFFFSGCSKLKTHPHEAVREKEISQTAPRE